MILCIVNSSHSVAFDTQITLDEKKYIKKWGELGPDTLERMAQIEERNTLIVETYMKKKEFYGKTLIFALNATHYKNELLELPADRPQDGWATGNYFRKIGKPLYNYYDYKFAGVNKETGEPMYWADETDENGKVVGQKQVVGTTNATRYELDKSPIPDVYGGFSTAIEAYGFDFAASFAYQLGGYAYDSQYGGLMTAGSAARNWHKDIFERWTPENTNTNVPRLNEGYQYNASGDYTLTSSSYLSLRNITLGYTLPKAWLSKAKIQKMRLYVVGDNMFLLSARKGFDPRQSFSGSTGYNYSALRTVSFGVNLEF